MPVEVKNSFEQRMGCTCLLSNCKLHGTKFTVHAKSEGQTRNHSTTNNFISPNLESEKHKHHTLKGLKSPQHREVGFFSLHHRIRKTINTPTQQNPMSPSNYYMSDKLLLILQHLPLVITASNIVNHKNYNFLNCD